jgi:hypothetical protein
MFCVVSPKTKVKLKRVINFLVTHFLASSSLPFLLMAFGGVEFWNGWYETNVDETSPNIEWYEAPKEVIQLLRTHQAVGFDYVTDEGEEDSPTASSASSSSSLSSAFYLPSCKSSSLSLSKEENDKKKDIMKKKQQQKALILGCGNSLLGEELVLSSRFSIVLNLDFSSHVIQLMNRNPNFKAIYKVADVCNLEEILNQENDEEDEGEKEQQRQEGRIKGGEEEEGRRKRGKGYDLIIDKGTLDALFCQADSTLLVPKMLSQVHEAARRRSRRRKWEEQGEGVVDFVVISAWGDREKLVGQLQHYEDSSSSSYKWRLVVRSEFKRQQPAHDAYAPESHYYFYLFRRTPT